MLFKNSTAWCLLWVLGAVVSAGTSGTARAGSRPGLSAEPISPETVVAFPHLQPYLGAILLATAQTQVVLSGVTALPAAGAWQRALETAFIWSKDHWDEAPDVGGLELLGPPLSTAKKSSGRPDLAGPSPGQGLVPAVLHATAVDLGRSQAGAAPGEGTAYASFIYSRGDPGEGAEALVTWRLQGGRLSVMFSLPQIVPASDGRSKEPASPAPRDGHWQLRWPQAADARLLGDPAAQAPTVVLLPSHRVPVVVIGYQPLQFELQQSSATLSSKSGPTPLEGYEFLLSRDAAAQAWARAAALHSCLRGVNEPRDWSKVEAVKLDWLDSCTPPPNTVGNLRLNLTVEPQTPAQEQPVYIFSAAGQLLQMTLLGGDSGVERTLALPIASGYQLADTLFGRHFGESFAIAATATASVALPALRLGQLAVELPAAAPVATLVGIEPTSGDQASDHVATLAAPDRGPLAEIGPQAVAFRLSPELWLLKQPRFSAQLWTGPYRLTATTAGSVVCRQYALIDAEHRFVLTCPYLKPAPLPAGLALADPSLSPDAVHAPAALLLQALALDLLGAPPPGAEPAASKLPTAPDEPAAPPKPDAAGPAKAGPAAWQVPVLAASHGGVSLFYWPATPALVARWQLALGKQPADPVGRFARFLADEQAPGISELGCPAPGMQEADYTALVSRLQPRAVRLIGCRDGAEAEAWLAVWTRLAFHGASAEPLLLSSDSAHALAAGSPFPPRLSFATTLKVPALAALLAEPFGVSQGGIIVLKGLNAASAHPAPAVKGIRPSRAKAAGDSDLTLTVHLAEPAQAVELSVYTEHGRIKKVVLPPGTYGYGLATVAGLKLGSAAWLRVEVRGMPAGLLSRNGRETSSESLLAATNFIHVASLRHAVGASP